MTKIKDKEFQSKVKAFFNLIIYNLPTSDI